MRRGGHATGGASRDTEHRRPLDPTPRPRKERLRESLYRSHRGTSGTPEVNHRRRSTDFP